MKKLIFFATIALALSAQAENYLCLGLDSGRKIISEETRVDGESSPIGTVKGYPVYFYPSMSRNAILKVCNLNQVCASAVGGNGTNMLTAVLEESAEKSTSVTCMVQ